MCRNILSLRSFVRLCSTTVLCSASTDSSIAPESNKYPAIDNYPRFYSHNNSMSKTLNTKLYSELRDCVSKSGFTVDNCIQPGIDNPGAPGNRETGAIAGDEDCFKTFKPLYDRVLSDFCGYSPASIHPDSRWRETGVLNLPKEAISLRVRVCRNISGHAFVSHVSRAGRRVIERMSCKALDSSADLVGKGNYQQVANVLADDSVEMANKFEKNNIDLHRSLRPYWSSCMVSRDWPDSRGIFLSNGPDDAIYAVTVNDRDHLRFILTIELNNSKQSIRPIDSLNRLFDFIDKVEASVKSENNGFGFAWDDHFGYLGAALHNLGTGMKFSVKLKLPHLIADSRMLSIIRSLPVLLSDLDRKEGTVIICNEVRMGVDENSVVNQVQNAIESLVEIEHRLADDKPIHDLFDF